MSGNPLDWTLLPPATWAQAVLVVALLGVGAGRLLRLSAAWRGAARGLALVLVLRIFLLGNPWIWQFYGKVLDAEEVGWRQAAVIDLQRNLLRPADPPVRYLAVGSSQTGRIYYEYARQHEDLELFTLAGMAPIDLVLYEDAILKRRPGTVLLYLSDFDLARKPPGNALVTAPRQGFRLFGLWATLRALPMGAGYDGTMAEMLLGEVFPEAKYNFVFRGIADEFTQKVARHWGRPDPEPESVSMEQRIAWLRETFDDRYVELNLHFLREFVADMDARGIRTVIVEGRYNPLASTDALRELAARAREDLQVLADEFASVSYLPSDDLTLLDEDSFGDLTHVTPEIGERMARAVVARLEGRTGPGRYNPAAEPVPRELPGWMDRVALLEERVRRSPDADVLFMGDSLVQGFEGEGRVTWEQFSAEFVPVNLGIAGDRTEHLLWRLQRMDLSGVDPRAVVLMIGSNNCVVAAQRPEEIAGGIGAIVAELRSRLPATHVLLHAIWPRDRVGDPPREKAERVNRIIEGLAADPMVEFVDIGTAFLEPDGRLRDDLMSDLVHLSPAGYAFWARQLQEPLASLLTGR